jgi:hypothetical protein
MQGGGVDVFAMHASVFLIVAMLWAWKYLTRKDVELTFARASHRTKTYRDVWRVACMPKESEQTSVVEERIDQLNKRTRVCTLREWTDMFSPSLTPPDSQREKLEAGVTEVGREEMRCYSTSPVSSICINELSMDARIRGLSCGHLFHLECAGQWFMKDQTFQLRCPLCWRALSEQCIMPGFSCKAARV